MVINGSPAFLHSLFLNPALRPAFVRAFGDGVEGLFAAIFSSLLVPKPSILREAAAFVSSLGGAVS